MRYFLVFLIALTICGLIPGALAAEALLGKVIAVDTNRQEMTIQLLDPSPVDEEAGRITVAFSDENMPAGIETGSIIRIWGRYTDQDRIKFHSTSMRMGGHGPGIDPTGVRSRLGRSHDGRGPGAGRMPHGGHRHAP